MVLKQAGAVPSQSDIGVVKPFVCAASTERLSTKILHHVGGQPDRKIARRRRQGTLPNASTASHCPPPAEMQRFLLIGVCKMAVLTAPTAR